MTQVLRPYQRDLDRRIRLSDARSVLAQLPTGAGKTHLINAVAGRHPRVLALAHAEWLIGQLHALLGGQALMAGMQHNGSWPIVGMVQTVARRDLPEPDAIIVDECFAAGTLVDGRPIEKIRPGELVSCLNERTGRRDRRRVLQIFSRKPDELVAVSFADGRKIVCTPGHPILTSCGWLPAMLLTDSCMVRLADDPELPDLRCSIPEAASQPEFSAVLYGSLQGGCPTKEKEGCLGRLPDLWDRGFRHGAEVSELREDGALLVLGRVPEDRPFEAFVGGYGRDEQAPCKHQNDRAQSDEERNLADQNGRDAEGYWPSPSYHRGEWPWTHQAADCFSAGSELGDGSAYRDQDASDLGVSILLQGGYRQSRDDGCDRGRRQFALHARPEGRGSQKGCSADFVRVESVQILQPGSDGRYGGLCPDGLVYNLHVDQHENYSANGIVAHNCHHAPSATYREILARWPRARIYGFTATPQRLDGLGLGDIFDELICGPSYQDLIGDGWLKPFELLSIPSGVDMAGARTMAGEFAREDVKQAIRRSTIFGDVVEHYLRHCRELGGHASFWPSIEMAEEAAERFRVAGVSCLPLHSKMSPIMVRGALDDLRHGTIQSLASVGMIGEGLDVPGLGSVSLCRPTKSLTVFLQQSGRCNRGGDGVARIMDHVANWQRHGLPDDDREWTLEGRVRRKSAPGTLSVWTCPECWRCNRSTVVVCPCGEQKPREVVRLEEQAAELELITRAAVGDIHEVCSTPEQYRRFASTHGKQPTWAAYQWWLRGNRASSENAFLAAAGQVRPSLEQYLRAASECDVHQIQAQVYARLIGLRRGGQRRCA